MSSFAKLLRYSKFMQLGNFENRLIVGKVVHRVADDLYVDMGLKFNAVCKKPTKAKPEDVYAIGSSVLVRLHDPELSERFLGSRHDLSLLEADATIVGLYEPDKEQTSTSPTSPAINFESSESKPPTEKRRQPFTRKVRTKVKTNDNATDSDN